MTAQPHTAGHLAARDSAQHPCPAPQTETFPPRAGGIPERGFLVCSGWWAWGRVFSAVTGGDNGIARKEGWASGPQPPKPWTVTPWWPALQQCQNTRKGELDPWRFLERRQPEGADRLRTDPSAECRGRDRSWRAVQCGGPRPFSGLRWLTPKRKRARQAAAIFPAGCLSVSLPTPRPNSSSP